MTSNSDEYGIDSQGKQYIGIMFECCSVYARIYKNKQGTHYAGWCPKCAKPVRLKVGEGGTENRFFRFT